MLTQNKFDNAEIPFLSICIPSYNRPDELQRLLDSIDSRQGEIIEIVIAEDCSPRREAIKQVVDMYKAKSSYKVNYLENEINYGYDHNIRHLADSANGTWVMFMGDDDVFVPGSLDMFLKFLQEHQTLGYVMRRYRNKYLDGSVEEFRYDSKDVFFSAGEQSYVELFRRSVFISGFCFRKECFNDYGCSEYDGTLLFQLYIEAIVCLNYPSAYCDIPITMSIEGGIPYFGSSEAESHLYKSGVNTVANSLNFMKQVKILAESIDRKNNIKCAQYIINTYSKYSYGFLLSQRDNGLKIYMNYARELKKMGYASSWYFYVYYYLLLVFGRVGSRMIISAIKRMVGKTPKL